MGVDVACEAPSLVEEDPRVISTSRPAKVGESASCRNAGEAEASTRWRTRGSTKYGKDRKPLPAYGATAENPVGLTSCGRIGQASASTRKPCMGTGVMLMNSNLRPGAAGNSLRAQCVYSEFLSCREVQLRGDGTHGRLADAAPRSTAWHRWFARMGCRGMARVGDPRVPSTRRWQDCWCWGQRAGSGTGGAMSAKRLTRGPVYQTIAVEGLGCTAHQPARGGQAPERMRRRPA